jgi:hypothetical protein
VSGPDFT